MLSTADKPQKILHVVPNMAYGGVEKMLLTYYEKLDHHRWVFDYVTHGPVIEYHEDLKAKGSRVYYFGSLGQIGAKQYREQIKNSIPINEYDVIHIHVGHLTGLYAKLFKKMGAKKIVCHAHTTKCVNQLHSVCMPIFRYLSKRYADRLVACGADAGRFCFGKAKVTLLPNGLDYSLFQKITNDDLTKLRKEFGISENTLIVGHVAHFSKQKNHAFLAEVIHSFVKENDKVVFILVGEGPDRDMIEKTIEANGDTGHVIFAGVRNDVYALMKLFDIFVLPSLFEGLPVVGIEAQAAGTPCLFSKEIDKTVSILKDSCEFLPIDQGPKVWADAIGRMALCQKKSDAEVYEALCHAGYEISATVGKLEEIYDSLFV